MNESCNCIVREHLRGLPSRSSGGRRSLRAVALVVLGVWTVLHPAAASAQQVFESVGERALGMGGAFVAVADDATAVYWNPAGLMHNAPGGVTIGWYRFQSGNQKAPAAPGPEYRANSLTSLGASSSGLSIGTFESRSLVPDTTGGLQSQTLRTRAFGLTLLQSLVPRVVAGATLKYVRGSLAAAPVSASTVNDALTQAGRLKGSSNGAFDLDVGLMADLDQLRVGLTIRNVRSPSFSPGKDSAATLPRESRFGLAYLPTRGLTLALDLDLDTVGLRGGPRRMCAVGGEARLGHLALRSGVRWNLEQGGQLVEAGGFSVNVKSGLWVDAHISRGKDTQDREFGVALRSGF